MRAFALPSDDGVKEYVHGMEVKGYYTHHSEIKKKSKLFAPLEQGDSEGI